MQTRITLVLLTLTLAAPAAHADREVEWETELGFQTSYEDNYFNRGDDSVSPDETFFTLYGNGEVTLEDVGPGELELSAGAAGAFAKDLDRADHQTYDLGVGYKLGRTRILTEYTHIEDRVFGEEDDASLFDQDSGEIEIRQKLTEAFSGRVSADFGNQDFTSPDNDRDALTYKFEVMGRYEAFSWLALRLSGLYQIKEANAARFDWDGPGFGIAAELEPLEDVNVFVRWRRRWREYDDARPGDSNFRRDDTLDDVVANLRWHATEMFGLDLFGGYRHNSSDRDDRDYDSNRIGAGIFVRLGSD